MGMATAAEEAQMPVPAQDLKAPRAIDPAATKATDARGELPELLAAYEKAVGRYQAASDKLRGARSEDTAARNELNRLAKEIRRIVGESVAEAR